MLESQCPSCRDIIRRNHSFVCRAFIEVVRLLNVSLRSQNSYSLPCLTTSIQAKLRFYSDLTRPCRFLPTKSINCCRSFSEAPHGSQAPHCPRILKHALPVLPAIQFEDQHRPADRFRGSLFSQSIWDSCSSSSSARQTCYLSSDWNQANFALPGEASNTLGQSSQKHCRIQSRLARRVCGITCANKHKPVFR